VISWLCGSVLCLFLLLKLKDTKESQRKDADEIPITGNFINVTNLSETENGLFLVQMAE
jgi:hypothetical protein